MSLKTISYSEARQNLAETMNTVVNDSIPVLIKSKTKRVVLLSETDYESLKETAYILSSPEDTKRILKAMNDVEEGRTIKIPLATLQAMI